MDPVKTDSPSVVVAVPAVPVAPAPVVTPVPVPVVTPAPVASPTGVAVVPAKAVPFVLSALAILGALIGLSTGDLNCVAGSALPNGTFCSPPVLPALHAAVGYMQAATAILMVVLGLTPGWRKAAAVGVVLLVVAPFALTACSSAPIRKEVCTSYVACAKGIDASAGQNVENTYGALSACWADARQGAACVVACEAGIASLKGNGIECPVLPVVKEVK